MKKWAIISALLALTVALLLVGCEQITPARPSAQNMVGDTPSLSGDPHPVTKTLEHEGHTITVASVPSARLGGGRLQATASASPTAAPGTPTGLRGSMADNGVPIGRGRMTLVWDRMAGATSHDMQWRVRNGDTVTSWSSPATLNSWNVAYIITDRGITVEVQIRATNAVGASGWSAAVSGIAPLPAPASLAAVPPTPTGVAVTVSPIDGWRTLSWNSVRGNTTTYEIQWRWDGSTKWSNRTLGPYDTTAISLSGNLEYSYFLRVRSRNVYGASNWSSTVLATTPFVSYVPDGDYFIVSCAAWSGSPGIFRVRARNAEAAWNVAKPRCDALASSEFGRYQRATGRTLVAAEGVAEDVVRTAEDIWRDPKFQDWLKKVTIKQYVVGCGRIREVLGEARNFVHWLDDKDISVRKLIDKADDICDKIYDEDGGESSDGNDESGSGNGNDGNSEGSGRDPDDPENCVGQECQEHIEEEECNQRPPPSGCAPGYVWSETSCECTKVNRY